MTEIVRQPWVFRKLSRERWASLADGLAIAVVVSLPWSTSATGILVALWFVVLIPTLDMSALRRVVATPPGGIPVLLWVLGLVGMLWAFGVPFGERWDGLKSLSKLLVIPLLMAQFRNSERGAWVLIGFLVSCSVLLVVSWLWFLAPPGLLPPPKWGGALGVPVKDYIAQATEFTACAFLIAPILLTAWRAEHRCWAAGLLLLALAFLANVAVVATSRTAFVIVPVLLLIFACRQLAWRGMLALLLGTAVTATLMWQFDTSVKRNVTNMMSEMSAFQPSGKATRAGERMEFWRKSIAFVAAAPLIGHGTGSIRDQFRRSAAGETGMAALESSIRTIRLSLSQSNSVLSGQQGFSRCGSVIFCCSAARGCWHGPGL